MRRALLFAPLLALSGCADCTNLNWHERGYRDGYGGHPPQDLFLARQCARLGVQVSQGDYLKGWAIGHDEHERLKTMTDL
ncbi:MAG: DUF2799 domain-containing protein [Burkholderiales bacterium]